MEFPRQKNFSSAWEPLLHHEEDLFLLLDPSLMGEALIYGRQNNSDYNITRVSINLFNIFNYFNV